LNPFTFLEYGTFTSKKETNLQIVYTTTQAQTLLRRCALWKRHILSRYTRKCDVICVHKKNRAFSAPILMKFTNVGQHYVRISDKVFDPIGKRMFKIHRDNNLHC